MWARVMKKIDQKKSGFRDAAAYGRKRGCFRTKPRILLASDVASHITPQQIVVDGGLSATM
jgi:hypothetical protein